MVHTNDALYHFTCVACILKGLIYCGRDLKVLYLTWQEAFQYCTGRQNQLISNNNQCPDSLLMYWWHQRNDSSPSVHFYHNVEHLSFFSWIHSSVEQGTALVLHVPSSLRAAICLNKCGLDRRSPAATGNIVCSMCVKGESIKEH